MFITLCKIALILKTFVQINNILILVHNIMKDDVIANISVYQHLHFFDNGLQIVNDKNQMKTFAIQIDKK